MGDRNLYYFVSDVHLGLRFKDYKERERLFASFLENLPPQTKGLYLLGDIFDFWYEYKNVIPKGFTRTLGALARLVDSGVEVHFFNGNHDIWTYSYLQSEVGLKIEEQPKVEMIEGKRFYLAHGDGLANGDLGYRILKSIFHCRFLQRLFSNVHPRWAFGLGHSWSKHNRLTKGDLYKFQGENEPLLKYAEKVGEEHSGSGTPIDYFIFGHYHLCVNRQLRCGSDFYILGEWINKFDYLLFDGEKIERRYWAKSE